MLSSSNGSGSTGSLEALAERALDATNFGGNLNTAGDVVTLITSMPHLPAKLIAVFVARHAACSDLSPEIFEIFEKFRGLESVLKAAVERRLLLLYRERSAEMPIRSSSAEKVHVPDATIEKLLDLVRSKQEIVPDPGPGAKPFDTRVDGRQPTENHDIPARRGRPPGSKNAPKFWQLTKPSVPSESTAPGPAPPKFAPIPIYDYVAPTNHRRKDFEVGPRYLRARDARRAIARVKLVRPDAMLKYVRQGIEEELFPSETGPLADALSNDPSALKESILSYLEECARELEQQGR